MTSLVSKPPPQTHTVPRHRPERDTYTSTALNAANICRGVDSHGNVIQYIMSVCDVANW